MDRVRPFLQHSLFSHHTLTSFFFSVCMYESGFVEPNKNPFIHTPNTFIKNKKKKKSEQETSRAEGKKQKTRLGKPQKQESYLDCQRMKGRCPWKKLWGTS